MTNLTSRATNTSSRATIYPSAKRRKLTDDHHQSLLPGLPDHIAHLCLSLVSPSALYSVCRSWRRLIYSPAFPPFRSLYTLSLPTTAAGAGSTADSGGQILRLNSFDPISSKWITIDSPPLPPFLHRHPSFISRNLSIQSLSVAGNLVLLAATSSHRNLPIPAFSHPLIFNPLSNTWSSGPPLSTPRRWCAAGAFQETVFVASGVGSHYTETVARSVEKWVFRKIESFDQKRGYSNGNCEKIQSLSISELKSESFDNRNHEKIQSLSLSEGKTESFDQKRRYSDVNREKIQSLSISEVKTESFDNQNHEKVRSLTISELKTESFDRKRRYSDGNRDKIQSLSISEVKTESFDNHNNEKIRSLTISELKSESFDRKRRYSNGNHEKIQSLSIPEQKTESFDRKRRDSNKNHEKIQSLSISEVKTGSFDNQNHEKIQSLTISELKTKSFGRYSDGNWEKMRSLKNLKLCREPVDAVGLKGKLCMVNVKGNYRKEGFVYCCDSDEWAEMPEGMLGGWKGPAAAMEGEIMYVVDESRGVLRRYNEDEDNWSEVVVDERLKGAEYIAAGGGRVCVVCENQVGVVVVDVVVAPPRLWVVEMSPGHEILALHILPRMCLPEF